MNSLTSLLDNATISQWQPATDLTSTTKPEDYQAIAPVELWVYCQNQLFIYHFDSQQYLESQISHWFPNYDLKTLIPQYIDQRIL
ncbi:hypothetical protein [[Phormidium] sp. LEGE 05292]|uniref:hypothetical protein n=1 Tax=[Phormidium] sp. LEGE 05292 TaxID=767427 RepID=UPI001D147FEA|nr:hypothetical protein [Phormidium sp. LEGE 05292]